MSFNERPLEGETHSKSPSNSKLPPSTISCGLFSKISTTQATANYFNELNSRPRFCTSSASPESSDSDESEISSGKLPEITGWRRALTQDKPAIMQLQRLTGNAANLLYRKRNIDELIDKSCFPIVQLDAKGKLISFTAYDSYPNIPSVPYLWSDWLNINYRLKGVNARNVLFLHYMVWEPTQETNFLRLLLETSFTEFIHLKHIILVKPPKANVPDFYTEFFIPILPIGLEKLEYDSIQSILVCLRSSIIQPLHFRTAFEEEINTVLSVIQIAAGATDLNKLSALDLISFIYQPGRKVLLCEFEGSLVGLMIINLNIDLKVLNEEFELEAFRGLRKRGVTADPDIGEFGLFGPKSSSGLHNQPNALISSEFLFSQMNWELMLNKIRPPDSLLQGNGSTDESFAFDSDFSEFSLKWSSIMDINMSEMNEEQKPLNSNSDQGKDGFDLKTGETKMSFHGLSQISQSPRPKYTNGHSNAFIIEFLIIDYNRSDKKRIYFDFLDAVFRIVPDRDYCVLLIPTDFIQFSLLELFVRTTPRSKSTFKQELYVCHKNSISIVSMFVRDTEKEDLVNIEHFLKSVYKSDKIYEDILTNFFTENHNFRSFVLTVGDNVVGVSVLDFQDFAQDLHLNFEVADYVSVESNELANLSIVKHLVLNPIYQRHARFFIQQIMTLADLPCLYYIYSQLTEKHGSLLTVLDEFIPIKPRRKAEIYGQHLSVQPSSSKEESLSIPLNSFSLYLINSKLCGLTKIHVNIVIVVVGASQTALAFMESLIYGPTNFYINYNNLICVTPHPLETEGAETEFKDLMFAHKDKHSRKYTSLLSLQTYVSFIYGVMTEINRSEKYIGVNNKIIVRYDYLILTCGLQYVSPTPRAKETVKGSFKNRYISSLSRFLLNCDTKKFSVPVHPCNMFVINTTSDAKNALRALKSLTQKLKNRNPADKKIILYGHDLNVFLTIQTLLKLGIPGEFIVFVEPFPNETTTVTLFNNHSVDQAVLQSVKDCKVNYYTGYFLYDWSLNSDDFITSITFHSSRKSLVIPCLAFFPYGEKLVAEITFNVCKEAGLVYDGKLVINHNFRTNDKYIYAAGSFTKYARRYYASDKDHQFYNSTEVGQKLAHIIRGKIDPTVEDDVEEESVLVPDLKEPIVLYCQLPGDFNYFVLRKPGKELDLETAYNFINYGEILTTGDCQMKKGNGYFRLHLNPEGFVESITCYTKKKIDYVNLSSLYGLHERLLNNMLLRYDLALIPDFFEYFRQPWAVALFHDNFQVLREYNHKAFYQKTSDFKKITFIEEVINELVKNKWNHLSESSKRKLKDQYQHSQIRQDIQNNLLEFLDSCKEEFPMYVIPNSTEWLIYKRTKYPAFKFRV